MFSIPRVQQATAGVAPGAFGGIPVDGEVIQKVRRIYEIISDSENDLEKILKLLS